MNVEHLFRKSLISMAVTALLATPGVALAQAEDPDTPEAGTPDKTRLAHGFYASGFRFLPQITLTAIQNDNIFADSTDEDTDVITIMTPSLDVRSDWERHRLNIRLGAEIGRYHDTIAENYEDHFLDVSGRYDFNPTTSLFGGAGYSFEHEGRDSPDDDLSGTTPTTFTSRNLHAGINHKARAYTLRFGATFEDLDYDNVPRTTGTLINDDRDMQNIDLGLRVTRTLNQGTEGFIQWIYDTRRYDDNLDQNGYARDSDGYRFNLGLKTGFGERVRLEAYAGLLSQDYDDNRLGDVSKPDFGAKLGYAASADTRFSVSLTRDLNETTLAGSAGYLFTNLDLSAQHRFTSHLRGHARIAYGEADYLNIALEDEYSSFGIGLRYYLTNGLYLGADYQLRERDSNDRFLGGPVAGVSHDYDTNLFLVSLGFLPYPKDEPALSTTQVSGTAELGIAYLDADSLRFGRYSGLTEEDYYLLGSVDVTAGGSGRDYTRLTLQDAGLDSRSLRFGWGTLGVYKGYLSYNQQPANQYQGQTVFEGVGTASLSLAPDWFASTPPPIDKTADMDKLARDLRAVEIGTERKDIGVGASLFSHGPWSFNIDYHSETKEGLQPIAAIVGSSPGNSRISLLPQAVDYTDEQLDIGVSYTKGKGQVNVNYHASLFTNSNPSLAWESPFSDTGSRYTDGSMSLAPDNEFHQLSLSGSYLLPGRSRISGIYALGVMTQDQAFQPYTINPGLDDALPRSSLDGKVYLRNAQVRLTSRPLRRLSLKAGYTLHERDSSTPQATYDYVWADSQDSDPPRTPVATNEPYSYKQEQLDVAARYRVHRKASVSLGYEHETMERSPAQVDETTDDRYALKVRLNPTDTVQMTLQGSLSNRNGSGYQGDAGENPLLRKYYMADRDREAAGVSISYQPDSRVSLSVSAQLAEDEYGDSEIGLTAADQLTYTLDGAFQVSPDTSIYAYYSRDEISSDQAGSADGSGDAVPPDWLPDWFATYDDTHESIGIGLKKNNIGHKIDAGIDYTYSQAESDIRITDNSAVVPQGAPFPQLGNDIHTLKLYADYRVQKNATVRFSYIHEEYDSDDWALDGVGVDGLGNVLGLGEESPDYDEDFIGISISYKF